ncbi:MAG: Tim44 domain-containing protein [Gammaproteobacteria bacterium]|nr:Tim44 domain-containing protein [Gammaproteobacteria bacterium]
MTRFIKLFVIALISSTLFIGQAEAKRFGGGKSFGYQRNNVSQQAAPKAPPTQAPASAPAKSGNRWLGPLMGLAAGGLLASLFMGHGFDGIKPFDIMLMLGIAALIFFVIRAMRRPTPARGQVQYAGHSDGGPAPVIDASQERSGMSSSGGGGTSTRPSWFDEDNFVRLAKSHFIRLQAANDARDLHDIREYTTPEIFAEISLQMQELGDTVQHTEVISVDAKVLDVYNEGDLTIASVRYTGQIREQANGPIETFDEIWHVQRSHAQTNANWHIAGIQQTPLAMAM